MSTYKHGTYGHYNESIGAVPSKTKTVAVYIGTAPVNLVAGYAEKGLVGRPISVSNYAGALSSLGYSADWASFSLCEAIKVNLNNPLGNVAPIIFINVLDPDAHRAAEATAVSLAFTGGSAVIESDKIILDTLTLGDYVLGVDYTIAYNFASGKLTITSIGETPITGVVEASYYEVDPAAVTAEDIVGYATDEGTYAGLGAVDLIYQTHTAITSLLDAPGWSHIPAVYEAMLAKASQINGHWDAFVVADIPVADGDSRVDTIALAKKWQTDNGYINHNSKVCWPQFMGSSGEVYHGSTLCAWTMLVTDNTHDGVPMETPSNKQIPVVRQYFGEGSANAGFDQTNANTLNEVGITTGVYWGGRWVLWGPHTAAYRFGATADAKYIFDNNVRMMMYVLNSFQSEWGTTVDKPLTRALKDTILNREQQKADALAAMGAFIGKPVVRFVEGENSVADLMEGNFEWSFVGTPTPPAKSLTIGVAYTSEGFNSYYEEA